MLEDSPPPTSGAPRPRRKPTWRAKLLLLAAALTVGLGLAEACLRLLGLPKEDLVFLPKDGSVEWDCYSTNYRNYFSPRTLADGRCVYCVDHAGEPPRKQNLADPANAGKYKVLAIGDSFTWGLGVKVVDSWPHVVETDLAKRKGSPVVVNNVGEIGRHVMEILEGEYRPNVLAQGTPDLCLYGWCLNDPLWIPAGRDDRANPLGPVKKDAQMDNADVDDFINIRTANLRQLRLESPLHRLRSASRVVDLGLRAWEAREIQQRTLQFYLDLYDASKNSRGLDVTWRAVAEMNRSQKAAGKRFVLAIFPMFVDIDGGYPLEPIHRAMAEKLTSMGVEFVDLLSAYKGRRTSDLWVHPVDRHPNDLAHRLAAEAVVKFLAR